MTKALPALKKVRKTKVRADSEEEPEDDDDLRPDEIRRDKVRGNNPFDPNPDGKSDKRSVADILKDYKSSGDYRAIM